MKDEKRRRKRRENQRKIMRLRKSFGVFGPFVVATIKNCNPMAEQAGSGSVWRYSTNTPIPAL